MPHDFSIEPPQFYMIPPRALLTSLHHYSIQARRGTLIAHRAYKFNSAHPLVYAGFSVLCFCCGLLVETLILVDLVGVGSG